MTPRVRDVMMAAFGELRYESTDKRVRAQIGGETVVDSTRAVLVWEPRHIVPAYAVPQEDVSADLVSAPAAPAAQEGLLHPGMAFAAAHSAEGEPLSLRVNGETREAVAYRLAGPELAGYLLLDFKGFDTWYEEDEPIVGHARDPFHRIDIRPSSRHVRVEVDGELVAETSRPTLLFETTLPVRFYMPREDVVAELTPSDKRTTCAYKGHASYWSVPGEDDLVWTYEDPLPEADGIRGLVAFFNERVDLVVDGERLERPQTQWSKR